MKRAAIPYIGIGLGVAVVLLLSLIMKPWQGKNDASQIIGELSALSGQVQTRLPRSTNFVTVEGSKKIQNLEQVATGPASQAKIVLAGGAEVELDENTRFIAETDASIRGGYIGTILQGKVSLKSPGQPPIRIFRSGVEISPEALEKVEVPKIGVSDQVVDPDKMELVITATQPDPSQSAEPSAAPSSSGRNDSSVITNEQIIRQMRRQTSFFQRCYLNFIHRTQAQTPDTTKSQTGSVIVSFLIENTGRVKDSEIARSDFNDSTLHKCIVEVVERTSFPAFQGDAVPVLEFPIVLQ